MSDESTTNTGVVAERFRFIFLTPWWRLVVFVVAVVWCAVLNIFFASAVGSDSWLGTLSVLPLYIFMADALYRLYRRSKAPAPDEDEGPGPGTSAGTSAGTGSDTGTGTGTGSGSGTSAGPSDSVIEK